MGCLHGIDCRGWSCVWEDALDVAMGCFCAGLGSVGVGGGWWGEVGRQAEVGLRSYMGV